jgi:A/G-specific adenine glycosylase
MPTHANFTRSLLQWYRRHQRLLPWRSTRRPYSILISETMLQQTQVSRVLLKYPAFLSRFPDFSVLASATPGAVIRAWQGMGYNKRALRLRELAGIVVHRHQGKLPKEITELLTLPGIGPYTAHAVACFAFGRHVPVVDTNVRRVLGRVFPSSEKSRDQWTLAGSILPKQKAYEWNQALMELGALVCIPKKPRCTECPWHKHCPSAYSTVRRIRQKPKMEPNRRGIPNRIYRGKVIEILRNAEKPVSFPLLMETLDLGQTRDDHIWLNSLLDGLRRDGLLRRDRNRKMVLYSLPR